jgi:hypothetical protein
MQNDARTSGIWKDRRRKLILFSTSLSVKEAAAGENVSFFFEPSHVFDNTALHDRFKAEFVA